MKSITDLGPIKLREEYQIPIHTETLSHMRESNDPAIVAASVGAGKTVNIAAIAKHMSDAGAEVLVLASQGELVEQNTAMARKCGLKVSIYSSSLGSKSSFYPAVFGTRGTVVKSLQKDFKDKKIHTILIAKKRTHNTS